VVAALGYGEDSSDEIALRRCLQQIADEAEYKMWFCSVILGMLRVFA